MVKEEEELDRYRRNGGKQGGMEYPNTPWLNSIEKAATIAKMRPEDIRFEIHHYAKRNRLVHSNVKMMINKGHFGPLAHQIVNDKRRLTELYSDSRRVIAYRLAIGRLESEWYAKRSYIDEDGEIIFQLNEKGIAKMRSLFP